MGKGGRSQPAVPHLLFFTAGGCGRYSSYAAQSDLQAGSRVCVVIEGNQPDALRVDVGNGERARRLVRGRGRGRVSKDVNGQTRGRTHKGLVVYKTRWRYGIAPAVCMLGTGQSPYAPPLSYPALKLQWAGGRSS